LDGLSNEMSSITLERLRYFERIVPVIKEPEKIGFLT
jgi:hypothetical protein